MPSKDLLTLQSEDPDEIRKRVNGEVARIADADIGMCYGLASIGEDNRVSWARASNGPGIADAFRQDAAARSPVLDPRRPSPRETQVFLEGAAILPPNFDESHQYRHHWVPNRIHDQIRLLVYSGPRFIGWVGGFRRKGQPKFDVRDRRRMARLVTGVRGALCAADTLDRQSGLESHAFLVVRPDGTVDCASRAAVQWLDTRGTREAVRRTVRRWERRGDAVPTQTLAAGAQVEVARLDASSPVRYLLTISPWTAPTLASDAELSPHQREIAAFVASGASSDEIARTLGRSRETVRSHVRTIYRRLGVQSRLELSRALEDTL